MRSPLWSSFSQSASYSLQDYEEVIIPPAKTVPPRESERLMPVSELDELARGSFPVGNFILSNLKPVRSETARGTHL